MVLPHSGSVGEAALHDIFCAMYAARCVDRTEAELVRMGEAFFHVSGAGHEGSAVLNVFLTPDDWLHCHYRDKALMLARGVPPVMFFHSLLCNAASHSSGRQMSAHMSDRDRRILSVVGPVGNSALQAVGVAATLPRDPGGEIVLCSLGDGTTQQGEVLEAIGEAVRSRLPVLFWIEDNGYSISTPTGRRTFYDTPYGPTANFSGIPVQRINGRDVAAAVAPVRAVVQQVRRSRGPALVVFQVDRLDNHTNADDQRVYREPLALDAALTHGDPIARLREHLISIGFDEGDLREVEARVRAEVEAAAEAARSIGDPQPCFDTQPAAPKPQQSDENNVPDRLRQSCLTMLDALRSVLRHRLATDPRVSLFGQDIEDPKGDVFGLTRGLSAQFPGRVVNSPLSESTILGMSIGRALAGERPVACIQFADFLPLAFNQIASELGSMYWRTQGAWQCPVIVMAPCGGYRAGLGPFHAQTFESILAHVPGIDVVMPSTAADAAGLLNAAFESQRPTVFLYPKVCLNDPDRAMSAGVEKAFVPLGKSRLVRRGNDLTIVAWGSTVLLCESAGQQLAAAGCTADILDLRSISPWDVDAVCESVERSGKLLVVHEDNLTCGFGAEVVARVAERVARQPAVRRVTRPDTYVPCNYANQLSVLPSLRGILNAAAELLGASISWEVARTAEDFVEVEAPASSPADQTVTIVEWTVRPGDLVARGQHVADAEADKAIFEITAPAAGVVESVLVPAGESVRVGNSILRIRGTDARAPRHRPRPDTAVPRLRLPQHAGHNGHTAARPPNDSHVTISIPYCVDGSVVVTNDEIAKRFPGREPRDILSLTGIEHRRHAAAHETPVSLAVEAVRKALQGEDLDLRTLRCLICSTSTPDVVSPSTACRILHGLACGRPPADIPAYDVSAACSGFLYALSFACDFLRDRPEGIVVVVTTETLSRVVDPHDFDTAVLFGDAATATVVYGSAAGRRGRWNVLQLHLASRPEDGTALSVPAVGCGAIRMNGRRVFSLAVRKLAEGLGAACARAGLCISDLDLIVPHQANGRILRALERRFPASRILSRIRYRGNTSSSSIPQCLADIEEASGASRIGLCAFGAGFTYGAAVLCDGRRETPSPMTPFCSAIGSSC